MKKRLAVMMILFAFICCLCVASAETTEESTKQNNNSLSSLFGDDWPDLSTFGQDTNLSVDMPQITGFDDDWYANFSLPEGFGDTADWSKFGSPTTGDSWGSLDTSAFGDMASSFEEFKNNALKTDQESQGLGTMSGWEDIKNAFNNSKSENDENQSTNNNIKDLFTSTFGKDNEYKEFESTPELPITSEDLKKNSSLTKPDFNSLTGELSTSISSLSTQISNKAKTYVSEEATPKDLSGYGTSSENTNVKDLYNTYKNNAKNSTESSEENTLYSKYTSQKSEAESLYNKYSTENTNDNNGNK